LGIRREIWRYALSHRQVAWHNCCKNQSPERLENIVHQSGSEIEIARLDHGGRCSDNRSGGASLFSANNARSGDAIRLQRNVAYWNKIIEFTGTSGPSP